MVSLGFPDSFLRNDAVSCFLCTKPQEETRKRSVQTRANRGYKWFPRLEIFSTQETRGFHFGFLMEGSL
jgi:hypothetical protein